MRKFYLSFFYTALFLLGSVGSYAQIVGTNCYLQGAFTEIGMNNNASFGTCNGNGAIPSTYHPHLPALNQNLAEVYDWGHDGWAVGTPPYMGDYTYPGSPFEGWELQIGTGRVQAFQNCAGNYTTGGTGMTMTGSITSYSNIGGSARGTWTGTATYGGATLAIRQVTRVDTNASCVIVTTVFRNTSGTTAPNVYYMRSCDPDNAETWNISSTIFGSFSTINKIVHQNEDARHLVLVKTYDNLLTEPKSYMGLGTKDCRAKCFIYSSWSLSSGQDLSTVWGGTYATPGSTSQYTLGQCLPTTCTPSDIAIGLVYNLGNIAAGDSAIISYAYMYNGESGIEDAFPDPIISVAGVNQPLVPVPSPNHDTIDVCAMTGTTTLNVDLFNSDDLNWSWSTWTWTPSLGLATTTGVHNIINTLVLPPVFTYTITGTDSASGMTSCLNKVFYLTILTCNGAEANSPCVGDTLWLNAPGDSSAATYQWYGPAPSTTVFATTQKTFIYPTTAANAGVYSVIKTVAGVPDTSTTTVTLHHKPTVWASSNAPLCIGSSTPLILNSVSDSPSVTYSWTAYPSSFTSTLQSPSISGFGIGDTGTYTVVVSTVFGCKDTDMVHVSLAPVPPAPIITAISPYCQNDAFVPFTIGGLVPGAFVQWYTTPVGGVPSATAPVVNTSIAGTYTFYASQKVGSCEGPRDTITVVVNPIPAPIAGPGEVCQYFNITLTDPTSGGFWSSGATSIATINASTGVLYGVSGGTATITYTLPTTCRNTRVITVHPKPAPPAITPIPVCQYTNASALLPSGAGYTWYGLGVTVGSPLSPIPNTDTLPGTYNYYVTYTSPYGCISDSSVYPFVVKAQPAAPEVADLEYCQKTSPVPALTAGGSSLLWYTTATSTPGSSTATVPSVDFPGTTSYWVSQTVNGCESPRSEIKVVVLDKPDFKIDPDRLWACQGDSIAMRYDGPPYPGMGYLWNIPLGASYVDGTNKYAPNVNIKFDTVSGIHEVYLTVSSFEGKCSTTDSVRVNVIAAPNTNPYIKGDLCLGDTMSLALADRSWGAYKFYWTVDGIPMASSPILDIISSNANTGGPFLVSWHDTGLHIITVSAATTEGCPAIPTSDTVHVHMLPDATFAIMEMPDKFCLEDSVLFSASVKDYANTYKWEPEHSFANMNKPEIWGRVEQTRAIITLTVTDPYGCKSTSRKELTPQECCTISMPNAFTPNADGRNDLFRPIFAGYHRFHIFRVSNRWGQTVFECTNSSPSWDGVYNGVPQDMGVYYYYIKYDCGGQTMEAKGDVTLIR